MLSGGVCRSNANGLTLCQSCSSPEASNSDNSCARYHLGARLAPRREAARPTQRHPRSAPSAPPGQSSPRPDNPFYRQPDSRECELGRWTPSQLEPTACVPNQREAMVHGLNGALVHRCRCTAGRFMPRRPIRPGTKAQCVMRPWPLDLSQLALESWRYRTVSVNSAVPDVPGAQENRIGGLFS
jgi:hypothetical protein